MYNYVILLRNDHEYSHKSWHGVKRKEEKNLSICLSIIHSVYLSIHLIHSVCIYLSFYISVCLCMCVNVCEGVLCECVFEAELH